MDVTYTDSAMKDLGELRGFRLDMEEGDERNDFELSLDIEGALRLEPGAIVYADGTEWGGVVDAVESSPADGLVRYTGRTWTGVLADKVLEPDAGQSHLAVSGEANAALLLLVERMGLSGRFTAPASDSGVRVSHTFERYCTGYAGIRAMLAASGAKLIVRCSAGVVELSAAPLADYSDGPDSDRADVSVRRVARPYNHLVSLGSGEGAQRAVRHDYADEEGNVSQTQTLFGLDERTAVYDYSNASAEELDEKGPEKLRELQEGSSWDASLLEGWEYDIGDVVPGIDILTGEEVHATVGGKIATVTDRGCSVEYRAGGTAFDASLSGSSEGSGGGVSYAAGKGISIVGRTINADVDSGDLEAVRETAESAYSTASGASAALAGKADKAHGHAIAEVSGLQAALEEKQPKGDYAEEGHEHSATDVTSGTLPVARGGTGAATKADAVANLLGSLSENTTVPNDENAVAQYVRATGVPGYYTFKSVWAYIKGKADALYAKVSHSHSAADITGGTLPLERGGTGAATAKAANYAILNSAELVEDEMTDDYTFAVVFGPSYSSSTRGALYKRTGSNVWAWIKKKADALYALKSHAHRYAGSDAEGGAANSAKECTGNSATAAKLKAARRITIAGAVRGSVEFDGSKDVTMTVQGDGEAANFLAAHPVGSTFEHPDNPGVTYGGTWRKQPGNMGCLKWERTA